GSWGSMENVNYDLLQKQVKYIMDSNMLNLPQFQHLPQEEKMSAILAMLNSNSD
uniref:HLJ1_G0022400.mRNA.1.CDS.1 n=1 Tax=Saccharomyces cerevisiae TaxID=4932 RepID=UPI001E67DFD3|nr:Chain A, HLJ1_G0022400.mRNA.1.CDS.1 [Saccharomyces cerevisiae]